MVPGLVLFGDNAYINSSFMATPFPNVSSGNKDDYNFFTLSFGSVLNAHLVCWSIVGVYCALRFQWALQSKKLWHLVNALAKLHNYCIDGTKDGTDTVCEPTTEDLSNITTSEGGYVSMERIDACDVELPVQLMDAGHHFDFDDIPETQRRVVESDMTRKMIKHRK
ncbi:hypothetical protein ACHAW5_003012 [Stephanodiscus triporus]|uniref:DDE Tnp4 domain-containing protein n=1 Tax=Stephanodiscus triporus TaxID=2934178 RepID=A0ABD3MWK8_9STRA